MFQLFNILKVILMHPLVKGNKLFAISNFFRFQLSSRIFGSPIVINWVDDIYVATSHGDSGMTGNIYCGLFEFKEMTFLMHYGNCCDTFYDIGANVGAYSLLASGVLGMHTVCFEPVGATYERLIRNINLNGLSHLIDARKIGVSDEDGILYFSESFNCTNKVVDADIHSLSQEAHVIALDSHFIPTSPSIVKIDVEGFEKYVLSGGYSFFNSDLVKVLIIELNGSGSAYGIKDSDIYSLICSFGFKMISYDSFHKTVDMISTLDSGGNAIFVKDLSDVLNRLSSSKLFTIHTANDMII